MIIPLIKPEVGREEAKAASDVILTTWINEGRSVQAFEQSIARYTMTEHAVAFFNGTVALNALLAAMGIGPGDEVIVPSFTFFSTVSTVVHLGARPVFADVSLENFGLDPADVEKRITSRTRAIIVVHYGGCPADMDGIPAVAHRHGIPLIEDAAEALGSSYRNKPVGGFGKAAMFSFTPTKVITTGEGGILTTHDGELASRLRLLKNHGQERLYHHVLFGFNYRMTEMQGAIGLAQMAKLNGIIENKRRVAEKISERLSDIQAIRLPLFKPEYFCTYMLYTIIVPTKEMREDLAAELERQDITTRVYFPPVHQQPVFSANGRPRLPVTEKLGETSLTLPCYASMTDDEITYMTDCIKTYFGKRNENYSHPA